ncbi:unnamed protein product [Haemonchus placei]|uniref:Uncharacterized protein n=1 Tax=Haemonchus placei TaxID=6290 RepID=A0A0N4WS16_HAEPC|nr:unnamed protein product [Haemonchus placei]
MTTVEFKEFARKKKEKEPLWLTPLPKCTGVAHRDRMSRHIVTNLVNLVRKLRGVAKSDGREGQRLILLQEDLRAATEQHYQPKKLVLAERFGLMSKMQKQRLALHEHYVELQKAANTYCFEEIKDHRDAVVTMAFVGGLLPVETRKRLLEKEQLSSREALSKRKPSSV